MAAKRRKKRYAGPKAYKRARTSKSAKVSGSRFHRLEKRVSKLSARVDRVESTTERTLKLVEEMAHTWSQVKARARKRRAA